MGEGKLNNFAGTPKLTQIARYGLMLLMLLMLALLPVLLLVLPLTDPRVLEAAHESIRTIGWAKLRRLGVRRAAGLGEPRYKGRPSSGCPLLFTLIFFITTKRLLYIVILQLHNFLRINYHTPMPRFGFYPLERAPKWCGWSIFHFYV